VKYFRIPDYARTNTSGATARWPETGAFVASFGGDPLKTYFIVLAITFGSAAVMVVVLFVIRKRSVRASGKAAERLSSAGSGTRPGLYG
jgi:hypothetical protein